MEADGGPEGRAAAEALHSSAVHQTQKMPSLTKMNNGLKTDTSVSVTRATRRLES